MLQSRCNEVFLPKAKPWLLAKKNQKSSDSQGWVVVYLAKIKTWIQTLVVLLLHLCQSCPVAAISLPIAIPPPSCRPLCCRHHPLPLPPSIRITPPPSIAIAAAVHLVLLPIAQLLHWWQPSAAHCAVNYLIANCNSFAILLPIVPPSLPIAAWVALGASYFQHHPLRIWCSQCTLRLSYSQCCLLRVWLSQHEGTLLCWLSEHACLQAVLREYHTLSRPRWEYDALSAC